METRLYNTEGFSYDLCLPCRDKQYSGIFLGSYFKPFNGLLPRRTIRPSFLLPSKVEMQELPKIWRAPGIYIENGQDLPHETNYRKWNIAFEGVLFSGKCQYTGQHLVAAIWHNSKECHLQVWKLQLDNYCKESTAIKVNTTPLTSSRGSTLSQHPGSLLGPVLIDIEFGSLPDPRLRRTKSEFCRGPSPQPWQYLARPVCQMSCQGVTGNVSARALRGCVGLLQPSDIFKYCPDALRIFLFRYFPVHLALLSHHFLLYC